MLKAATHRVLALHTTEPEACIALGLGERFETRSFEAAGHHAPAILAEVVRLFEQSGIALESIEALAVTTGPGSFTGIRVGLATAQGLAAARGWPVWACDSLRARAATYCGQGGLLGVVLDARRGEVYAAAYEVTEAVPIVRVPPFCAVPEVAALRLAGVQALTGSGTALVLSHLVPAPQVMEPARLSVARALVGLARAGACSQVAAHELEPLYLRKSDAEVRRDSLLRPEA